MTDEIEIDPRLERIVWKRLGVVSVRQIAEETGLTPEQIFVIKREMLDAVDVLSIQEQRQKLIITLQEIAQNAQDDYANAPFEFKAGLANSAVASMKTIMTELNRTQKGEQEALDRLNEMRVKELLRLIDLTVARTLEDIASTYDLDEGTLHGIFQSYLKPAAEELDA